MDPANLGSSFSIVREHLPLFLSLLFGLPVISFVAIKIWIASGSSKTQRTTNWVVPDDLESESATMHYSMQHNPVAVSHRIRRDARPPFIAHDPGSRRRV